MEVWWKCVKHSARHRVNNISGSTHGRTHAQTNRTKTACLLPHYIGRRNNNTRHTTVSDGRGSLSSDVADVDCWLPVATIARIRRTFSASDSDFPEPELMRLFLRWWGVSRLCNRPSFSVKSSDNLKPTLRVLPSSSSSSPSYKPSSQLLLIRQRKVSEWVSRV